MKNIYITDFNVITGFGKGLNCLWNNVINNNSCIKQLKRFDTTTFISSYAGLIAELSQEKEQSLFFQIIELLNIAKLNIKTDTKIFIASSKGEIDLLDRVTAKQVDDQTKEKLQIDNLIFKAKKILNIENDISFISAACASSSIAIAQACRLISNNLIDSALIITADAVSQFVYSGFSSLLALDPNPCSPFSSQRKGLTLGEGGGYMMLESYENVKAKIASQSQPTKDIVFGEIVGWGNTNDANHITGPSRDGSGLANAINNAISSNSLDINKIKSVCAHGTGTIYNDLMEIKALTKVFNEKTIPTYSIKGATGHSLGACGLIESLLSIKALKEEIIPFSVKLKPVDEHASNWITTSNIKQDSSSYCLNINSGFGGINSALILKNYKE